MKKLWLMILCGMLWNASAEPLRLFCTIAPQSEPLQELVKGTDASVTIIVPPGANPETFAIDARTLRHLAQAHLYFTIGAPNEEPMMPKLQKVMTRGHIIDGRKGMALRHFAPPSDGEDPHVWLSVKNMAVFTRNAAAALIAADAGNASLYQRNAEEYLRRLKAIDREIETMLAPVKGQRCLTYHPAFGYFFSRYGIDACAIECEGREPPGGYLQRLISQCKEAKLPALFVQPQFNRRTAERLATQIGCRIVVIDPLPAKLIDGLRDIAEKIATAYAR